MAFMNFWYRNRKSVGALLLDEQGTDYLCGCQKQPENKSPSDIFMQLNLVNTSFVNHLFIRQYI